jgi:hypothetical protein
MVSSIYLTDSTPFNNKSYSLKPFEESILLLNAILGEVS